MNRSVGLFAIVLLSCAPAFGKVFSRSNGNTINVFAEPQWTVDHRGAGQPKFQVFAGVNLQFALHGH